MYQSHAQVWIFTQKSHKIHFLWNPLELTLNHLLKKNPKIGNWLIISEIGALRGDLFRKGIPYHLLFKGQLALTLSLKKIDPLLNPVNYDCPDIQTSLQRPGIESISNVVHAPEGSFASSVFTRSEESQMILKDLAEIIWWNM